MAEVDFDRHYDRGRSGDSVKWSLYPPDVLPMWIADTDFAVPQGIVDALAQRVTDPLYGYSCPAQSVRAAIVDWLAQQYDWQIEPQDLVFLPGTLPGIAMAMRAMLSPGEGVAVQLPVYGPIHRAPGLCGYELLPSPLIITPDGVLMGDYLDVIAKSRATILCNPQNPTGKVYSADELRLIAATCEDHDVLIVSDEVHCDLTYAGQRHVPIASLSPEIAARTVTLMSAGKTFNLAGLKLAFAVICDKTLRLRFESARMGMVPLTPSLMGLVATEAAFRGGNGWREAQIEYLEKNCAHLAARLRDAIPAIRFTAPQASFLAWLDCRALDREDDMHRFFLEQAKVGLSAGSEFGLSDRGFVRLNFGCPRDLIDEAVERMTLALAGNISLT